MTDQKTVTSIAIQRILDLAAFLIYSVSQLVSNISFGKNYHVFHNNKQYFAVFCDINNRESSSLYKYVQIFHKWEN